MNQEFNEEYIFWFKNEDHARLMETEVIRYLDRNKTAKHGREFYLISSDEVKSAFDLVLEKLIKSRRVS